MHTRLAEQKNLVCEPELALKKAICELEKEFLRGCMMRKDRENMEKSGSCLLVVLVVENKLIVANVGDSRCFIVRDKTIIEELSQDHKPLL